MLTLGALKSHVEHALGGTPASQLSAVDIVNQAGRQFFNYHWNFRTKGPREITTTANQSYVELPGNLGHLIHAYMKDGLTDSIRLTTLEEVVKVRNSSISTGANYLAAITWPEVDIDTEAPRMELAPIPTSEDVITVSYMAVWEELSEEDAPAKVPPYAESALIQMVRAFALGYEEENMSQRIMETVAGPIFEQAFLSDGLVQNNYGPIQNGVFGALHENRRLPFDAIANPSS